MTDAVLRVDDSRAPTFRQIAGVVLKDLPIWLPGIARGGRDYLKVRNRAERLLPAPDGSGYACDWQWTRELHAPTVLPWLGRQLMRRALADHAFARSEAPATGDRAAPDVSFVIGHRGSTRVAHLLATLECIAAQQGVNVECIVVEQEVQSQLRGHLPAWVRLVHTPPPNAQVPFSRSQAFNDGAAHARGRLLVLHDNDLLVPTDYARQSAQCIEQGFELVNLKRFIFYLNARHTASFLAGRSGLLDDFPESVLQNAQGGGSIAITRDAFDSIGGMDETFVGWGGEDNEFWERGQMLKVWPWGNMPLVHLWHAPQEGRKDSQFQTARLYRQLSATPPAERARLLRARHRAAAARTDE